MVIMNHRRLRQRRQQEDNFLHLRRRHQKRNNYYFLSPRRPVKFCLLLLLLIGTLAAFFYGWAGDDSDLRYLLLPLSSTKTTSIIDSKRNNNNNNNNNDIVTYSPLNASECGVWFAPSTIPGAGLGMFAGKHFKEKEMLLPSGDIVIPLVDMTWFHGSKYNFLWDEYMWSAHSQRIHLGLRKANGISPGFGAAINSYYDLFNIDEGKPVVDSAGLNYNVDPGYGAFTHYHNREAWAYGGDIRAGQELFTDYGESWFRGKKSMEFVPLSNHMSRAQITMLGMAKKRNNSIPVLVNETLAMIAAAKQTNDKQSKELGDVKRILGALPKNTQEWTVALQTSLKELRLRQTNRGIPNLEKTGACIDNIRAGPSTLFQAGRGAFSTRHLPKNTVVAPVPLIHIANRSLMDTYSVEQMEADGDRRRVAGQQLMLNYCFGHPHSTLLLSPYGYATSLVNHNRTLANVKLRWGDPQRSNHHPDWLSLSVEQLAGRYVAGLAWEFVSLRDIETGEEIFMDYGEDWENAWLEHVRTWKSPLTDQRTPQITTDQLNQIPDALKTWNKSSYSRNGIQLMGYYSFHEASVWKDHYKKWGNYKTLIEKSSIYSCEITSFGKDEETGEDRYNATYYDGYKLVDVPREAFVFVDSFYKYNERAFRHDMRIPDELMPIAWQNNQPTSVDRK